MSITNTPPSYPSSYYGGELPDPAGSRRPAGPASPNPTTRLALDLASGATRLSDLSPEDRAAFQAAAANMSNLMPDSVMVDATALLMVALEFATRLKETISLFKESASQKAIQEHLDSAIKGFEAADAQWNATVVEGVAGIVAGGVETAGAAASLDQGLKAGEADMARAQHQKSASDIAAQAPHGQLTPGEQGEMTRLQKEIQDITKQMKPQDIELLKGTRPRPADLTPNGRKLYEDEILPRRQRMDEIQRMPQQRADAMRNEQVAAQQSRSEAKVLRSKESAVLALARGLAQMLKAISQFPEGQFSRQARELDALGKLDMASGEGWEALARTLGELITQLQALLQSAQDGAKTIQQTTRDTDSAINHIA